MKAQELKEFRKKQNLTQGELAKALKVSKGLIYMWESGRLRVAERYLSKIEKLKTPSAPSSEPQTTLTPAAAQAYASAKTVTEFDPEMTTMTVMLTKFKSMPIASQLYLYERFKREITRAPQHYPAQEKRA